MGHQGEPMNDSGSFFDGSTAPSTTAEAATFDDDDKMSHTLPSGGCCSSTWAYCDLHRTQFWIVVGWFAVAQAVYPPNQPRMVPCDFDESLCTKLTAESFAGKRLVYTDNTVKEQFIEEVPHGCI